MGLPVPQLLDGPTLLEVTAVAGPLVGFVVTDDKDSNCGGGGVLPLRRHRGLDTMLKCYYCRYEKPRCHYKESTASGQLE